MISQCEDPVEPSVEIKDGNISHEAINLAFADLPYSGSYDLRNIAIYVKGDQNSEHCCERHGYVIALLHVGYEANFEDLRFEQVKELLAEGKVLALYPVADHGWWLSYIGNEQPQ